MNHLGDLTSADMAGGDWTLLIPMGSIEQHGPHLPLDTDTRIAVELASRAAAEFDDVVVAPALAIGASGEHAGFAGTLSVGTEVGAQMVIEIVRTAGPEFGRIVVVSGHGGNAAALQNARDACEYEGRALRIWWPRLQGGDAHAGRTETSVMLAIAPESVRIDLAEIGATTPIGELADELRAGRLAEVSPNGILGDPTGATAAEGDRILATWLGEVVGLLQR